ncbi:MAG: hypothetical protein HYX84_05340 [Chloroflexi bacterium]|nr:hypothetical protein [Chloroflexota bacterium]
MAVVKREGHINDRELGLVHALAEKTRLLRQKERELEALNNLFVECLNQRFETAETYGRLINIIIRAAEEIRNLAKEAEPYRVEYSQGRQEGAK